MKVNESYFPVPIFNPMGILKQKINVMVILIYKVSFPSLNLITYMHAWFNWGRRTVGDEEKSSLKLKLWKYKKRKAKELRKVLKGNKDFIYILTVTMSNTQNGFVLGYQLLSRLSRPSASGLSPQCNHLQ